jgi:Ran GTPase-activating protein (RanGAP) involved in mRNA processing and transport
LTRLESWACFPEAVLVSLFEMLPRGLEALVIIGQPYIDYQPELIKSDVWLSPSAMRVVAESASLKAVRELRVENERVGDVLVAVVAACTPGRLRRLELVDVGLTDDGAEALARLPQLAGVAHLDLRANQLGPNGIAAICRSPYLTGVTKLAIGGRSYNPYYDDKHVQGIGDDGLAAIVAARAFADLRELEVANASVSPAGVAVLAGSPLASRLRRLDLSTNDLGFDGAVALAVTPWPVLRDLRLRRCALDDAAIEPLAQADFRDMRDLDLSYNSVGQPGAVSLATSARLETLWRLNLHDNFIGDTGLIALARSRALTRLVELDLEQDCWNDRQARFSDEAARAVANSVALSRLDNLFGGRVDEYHCSREEHPFTTLGLAAIDAASALRPALRGGLRLAEALETEVAEVEEATRMTKEAAREVIQNFQAAITTTLGDAGKPASDILGALLANGGNNPIISPSVETPPSAPPDFADDLRSGHTNDFRFRANLRKDRRPATE